MEKIWKPIEGYGGRYEVSEYGEIRSLNYHHQKIVKELKPKIDRYGYVVYCLRYKDKKHYKTAHRLVLEAFKGEIPEGYQINHIDENKRNNNLFNLNLMSPKENVNWGTRIERIMETRTKNGSVNGRKPTLQFTKDGQFVAEYESATSASKATGVNRRNICVCCNGKQKTCGGFVWKYK